MRFGFTTGSCAAAASKAACYMLLSGTEKTNITIETPKGIPFAAEILEIEREEKRVSCAVRKDGGDDPDITTGALIYASVSVTPYSEVVKKDPDDAGISREELASFGQGAKAVVRIDGGAGVGRVTRPGLDQPVGNAAINHVPREMIEKEVREVCELLDFQGIVSVEISVPGGEELAAKTFNPRLGIAGGISILGTSGVVEPMSSRALLDTIHVELNQKKTMGYKIAAVSPGNYGLDFMKKAYGYDLDKSVKCSNFIGDTIDMAVELGFEKMLLTGHIGKLVKVSGGIMNTHSKEGDCRMELLTSALLRVGSGIEGCCKKILQCLTTEEALVILREEKLLSEVMDEVMNRIMFYLKKRGSEKIQIECILYSNDFGELAKSQGAEEMLAELTKDSTL